MDVDLKVIQGAIPQPGWSRQDQRPAFQSNGAQGSAGQSAEAASWAQVVSQVLPRVLPGVAAINSGRPALLNIQECARLIATCSLPALPYRKFSAMNPPGTRTHSAPLASAKMASIPNPLPGTTQPPRDTDVFPFSQVTPAEVPVSSEGPMRESWADVSESEPPQQSVPQSHSKRLLSPPYCPLLTRTMFSSVQGAQREEFARQRLTPALERLGFVGPPRYCGWPF